MNYERLVHNLRKKAYDYGNDKAKKFSRVLSEAKKRKIANYYKDEKYLKAREEKNQQLLFRTR